MHQPKATSNGCNAEPGTGVASLKPESVDSVSQTPVANQSHAPAHDAQFA
jgi:hypothetical protein